MYHDYHLKFTTESAADAVLFEGDDRRPRYAAIDVIGVIYKPTGKMLTTDDGAAPEMAPVPGWHVNVRHTQEDKNLAKYAVFPNTPERVWF